MIMHLDSGGSVGLRTIYPNEGLHVLTAGTSTYTSGATRGLLLTNDVGPRLVFEDTGEGSGDRIMTVRYEDESLYFASMADNGGSYDVSNIMAIHRDGNVSINSGSLYFNDQGSILNVGAAGNDWTAHSLIIDSDYDGSNFIQIKNSSNNAGTAFLKIQVSDASGGDAFIDFQSVSQRWSVGADTSHDGNFKISSSTTLHTDTRFIIKTDGNVGVGTTNPQDRLEVSSTGHTVLRVAGGTNSSDPAIEFWDRQTAQIGGIRALQTSGTIDRLVMGTANAEQLVILASGNVGIGTSSPMARLEVEDNGISNPTYFLLHVTADDQGPYAFGIGNDTYSTTDSNSFIIYQKNDGSSLIKNAGSDVLTIEADGDVDFMNNDILNVGNPASEWTSGALLLHSPAAGNHAKLELNMIGGGSGDAIIRFQETGTSKFTIGLDDTDTKFKIAGSGDLGSSDRLTIDASGYVGIGISPSYPVHISGNSGTNDPLGTLYVNTTTNHGGIVVNSPSSKQAHIRFAINGALKWQWRAPAQTDTSFRLYGWDSPAGDKMTILANGNVGIGTTSPDDTLHVDFGASGYQILEYNTDQYAGFTFHEGGSEKAWFMYDDRSGHDGFYFLPASGSTGSSLMSIRQTGNVGIGTAAIDPSAQLEIAKSAAGATAKLSTYSTTDTNMSNLAFQKSASNTIGTLVATVDDESLGYIDFRSINNAGTPASSQSAYLSVYQNAGTSARPAARMVFAVSDGANIVPNFIMTASSSTATLEFQGTGVLQGTTGSNHFYIKSGNSITLDAAGQVLYIGNTNDTSQTIHIRSNTASTAGFTFLSAGGQRGKILYNHASDAGMEFWTSGAKSVQLSGGATPTLQFQGAAVLNTTGGNMTFGTGATYTILYGSYVQLAASNMNYISSGKLRLYDGVELELGSDADAFIRHTGSNMEITNTTGNLTIGTTNGDMYLYPNGDSWDDVYIGDGNALCRVHLNGTGAYYGIDWSEGGSYKWAAWYHSADNKLYFRRNDSTDTNVMAFTDGSDEVTFYGTVKIAGGSPADGKVWTATDSNGAGNWEDAAGGGEEEVDVMVLAMMFG